MAAQELQALTIKGRTYKLDPAKLGPADDRLCRDIMDEQGHGRLSVIQTLQMLTTSPGLDVLAVVMLFCRRQAGETDVTIAAVEEGLTLQDLFDALESVGMVVEEVDDPLASTPETDS